MKHLLSIILVSGISVANAEVDYSGIWKDEQGIHYSIHQSNDSIVVGKLYDRQETLSPGEQGSIYLTDNELDLAIAGYGFFVLVSEDGAYTYTRDGRFHLSSDSEIVNERGDRLLTENQSSIPVTTDGLEAVPGMNADTSLSCGFLVECAPPIEQTGTIIISSDGEINLRDPDTGELFALDRILLAWIPPERITFSGYPISIGSQSAISYFHPGEEIQREPPVFGASILQGSLEVLSYEIKVWDGYYGEFDGSAARLSPMSDSYGESDSFEEIHFNSDSSATITFACPSDIQLCNASQWFQDRQLSKVY